MESRTIVRHADKVAAIRDFLNSESLDYLVIIGDAATGKSFALNEALKDHYNYNIMIWNEKEKPDFWLGKRLDEYNDKWILVRRSLDNLAIAFQNEWKSDCITIQFERKIN